MNVEIFKLLSKGFSSAVIGVDAYIVEVEVDIGKGLPVFSIVGLPEASVKESKDRIKSAISNSGYEFPMDRITVNLAPADIKKVGTGFDLPIAMGILGAMALFDGRGLLPYIMFGELSLDGRIKPVNGGLPIALSAKKYGFQSVVIPFDIRKEVGLVQGIDVIPVRNLSDLVEFLRGARPISPETTDIGKFFTAKTLKGDLDLSEVVGQAHVKRALEIAAAGGHNVLMIGPPGSGKSMLAKRIPTILPPMTFDEALETTKIFSVVGLLDKDEVLLTQRPFRSPHHNISDAGLIGGGHIPRPGEISLAHNGVLFLDELPEYRRNVLEGLRQPLEDGRVTIGRAAQTITYPSSIMLVGAMNPCPCGYLSDSSHRCSCSKLKVDQYRSRISGPLMDRFDIHVDVPAVDYRDLMRQKPSEASTHVRQRVVNARNIQSRRLKKVRIHCNAQMDKRHIQKWCPLDKPCTDLLESAVRRMGLSARAFHRIIKISRTIADLDGAETISETHLSEAIQYRGIDRKYQ